MTFYNTEIVLLTVSFDGWNLVLLVRVNLLGKKNPISKLA